MLLVWTLLTTGVVGFSRNVIWKWLLLYLLFQAMFSHSPATQEGKRWGLFVEDMRCTSATRGVVDLGKERDKW